MSLLSYHFHAEKLQNNHPTQGYNNVSVLRVVRIGAILEWNGNKWESSLGPPILECNPCPSAILESPARSVRIWVQVRIHFL